MRKQVLALALALLLFTAGCSGSEQSTAGGFQPDFTTGLRTWVEMAAVEDGYFVVIRDVAFYVEKSTLDYTVFCADPTCQHRSGSCLARRIGTNMFAIQVYDGEIYSVDASTYIPERGWIETLQAVKIDGTGLRDVRTFFDQSKDRWPDAQSGSHFQYAFAILND